MLGLFYNDYETSNYRLSIQNVSFAFIPAFLWSYGSVKRVSPDPKKVMAISKLAAPIDVHTLCSFLSCYNYYDCFVLHYIQKSHH